MRIAPFFAGSLLLLPLAPAAPLELVLTDSAYGATNASALDQPRLYAQVTDPLQNDAPITWFNPESGTVEPVVLRAFIDTGASGVVLSHLHAAGLHDQPDLGLGTADYLGPYTELGIAGTEVGDVSRPLGIRLHSGPAQGLNLADPSLFDDFGNFKTWIRRQPGTGEIVEILGYSLISPFNIVGMPAIRQRRLWIDVSTVANPLTATEGLICHLLPPGAVEPPTHATVPLVLHDFIGDEAPPGEVIPSHHANPLVPGVGATGPGGLAIGSWLLDTGAGSTFLSFASARACGIIPAGYDSLAAFLADYEGPTSQVGGIGGGVEAPRLTLPRLSIPTREGVPLIWENVEVFVADVAGLDGIFGMNLLIPAVNLDPDDPLASLYDFSPTPFDHVIIDTTDPHHPVMRLSIPAASGTVLGWLASELTADERRDGDIDDDGRPNLLEYALGSDPRVADPSPPATSAFAPHPDGTPRLAFTFTRSKSVAGLSTAIETSTDLQNWHHDPTAFELLSSTDHGDTETVTYRTVAAPADRLFLRVSLRSP